METESLIKPISPSIDIDPAKNFPPWAKSVKRTASSMLADEYPPYGMLHLVMSPAGYAALPDVIDPIPNPQRPEQSKSGSIPPLSKACNFAENVDSGKFGNYCA